MTKTSGTAAMTPLAGSHAGRGVAPGPLTWPENGPAVINGAGPLRPGREPERLPVYRQPTLVMLTTGGRVSARGDARLGFAFTEDNTLVTYTAIVPQNDLFRILHAAGLLKREIIA